MTSPVLEPLADLDDVLQQMSKVKSEDQSALVDWLSTASDLIRSMCVPVQPATVTDLLNGGQPTVLLSTYPVTSVVSVTTYDSSGPTVLSQAGGTTGVWNGWALEPGTGVLHRVGWGRWPVGWGNVEVVYTVGPAQVPNAVRTAAVILTEHLWQYRKTSHQPAQPGNDPMGFSPQYAIPNKVIELVRDYLKPPRVG